MEDAANRGENFASEDALKYWENVDLYIGGSEHATGHLLYSRFWVKLLKDRGFVGVDEPFKKLINQGMILGTSAIIYRIKSKQFINPVFFSKDFIQKLVDNKSSMTDYPEYKKLEKALFDSVVSKNGIRSIFTTVETNWEQFIPIHADVSFVNSSDELDIEAFRNWRAEFKNAEFITEEDGTFKVSRDVEKMSKSKYNVVNPDDIVEQYGADSLRLYEMFLGPLEQYKPWNTSGITGVHNFLKKLWKLYVGQDGLNVNDVEPSKDNLKTLHKTIKKVEEDIENFSFNTSVSTFMIAVNELTAQKCTSKDILQPLLILISPYAPHIAEELWSQLGNSETISTAPFPKFEASHLVESSKNYPISFNGKMRFTMELPMDMSKDDIEAAVMAHEKTIAQLDGRTPKKVIVVPGKIVNIVG
jgi:leucyl-tRNA synthetase